MTVTISITPGSLEAMQSALGAKFEALRQPVQAAMAEQYLEVVQSNFGATGLDRPWPWEPLSDRSAVGKAYIKKVGRTYATLFETGSMFSTTLHSDSANPEAATVSMVDSAEAPYATRHHHGGGNLPARRVFPMNEDGTCTEMTLGMVRDAAIQTVKENFR